MRETILLPSGTNRSPRTRRLLIASFAILLVILFSTRTAVSYYVDGLWFGSLGYSGVFWKTLGTQWTVFGLFAIATFAMLYGWFMILMRVCRPDLRDAGTIVIGTRTIRLPVEGVLRLAALLLAILIGLATGA